MQKKVPQRPTRFNADRQQSLGESDSEQEHFPPPKPSSPQSKKTAATSDNSKPLKSILKRTEQPGKLSQDYQSEASPTSGPSIPQGVRDRLAADDAEIAALEKALGVRGKKKLPKSFEDDGLDLLIEGLEEPDSKTGSWAGKRKRTEEEEWLETKRRKAQGIQNEDRQYRSGSEQESGDDDGESLLDDGILDEGSDELRDETLSDDDDFSGFGSDSSPPPPPPKRVRENPYIAPPVASDTAGQGKYIPPSLRTMASSDAEASLQLRRQTQGLLNRLSEANLISILGDVERLYRDNPRQHVTSTLVDILLGLICDRTTLQDTFVILHAGFIAAIYKIVGTDFGAQVVQRVVEEFDRFYVSKADSEGIGKESANLVSLLAELYNFQVIGSILIFDYVRLFLRDMSEVNTELLLKIIRGM